VLVSLLLIPLTRGYVSSLPHLLPGGLSTCSCRYIPGSRCCALWLGLFGCWTFLTIAPDATWENRINHTPEINCRRNGRNNLRRNDISPRHHPHPSLRSILLPGCHKTRPQRPSHRKTPRHVPYHRAHVPHRGRNTCLVQRTGADGDGCGAICGIEFRGL